MWTRAATRSGEASWECWEVQEIDEKTELPDSDQTRQDITFVVSVVSQFLSASSTIHLEAVIKNFEVSEESFRERELLYSDHGHTRASFSDVDWIGCPFDRRLTIGCYVFLEGNLVPWKSKKQSVVSRSIAESEYRVVTNMTSKADLDQRFIDKNWFSPECPMRLYDDN